MKLINFKDGLRMISLFLVAVTNINLIGCAKTNSDTFETTFTSENREITSESQTKFTSEEMKCLEAALLYRDIYISSERTAPENYITNNIISQKSIDKIENLLIQQKLSVMNSDEKYPTHLVNSDAMMKFLELISQNKEAECEIYRITETGGLFFCCFKYLKAEMSRIGITVEWDENNNPYIASNETSSVFDWALTENNNFYYKIQASRGSYDDYSLIRLEAVDRNLYDLTEKYISRIGYLNNNMFVCNWSCNNYGELSFNDTFEYFYKINYNSYFDPLKYENVNEPFYHTYIPSALFEETILPYFRIDLEEFRERCLYNSEKDCYPWQEIFCDNVVFYPAVEPLVVSFSEEENNILKLTVNAMCNDYKTDRLFSHEVVIEILENGCYKYLSNTIIEQSEYELPPNFPRLPQQRTH